jgi:CheY-like chemotaxis protein
MPLAFEDVSMKETVILLAEDEVIVQRVAARVLSQAGYFILCGDDGMEALKLSRRFTGRIHLLLTDLQMPNLNGVELIRRLRQERPDTRILAMSGQSVAPGMAADIPLLQKPFTPATLKERVSEIILDSATGGVSGL